MREVNAIVTIAYRDCAKFLRDRTRIAAAFVFPFLFIVVLGNSLQSSLGASAGFDFLTFIFLGILAQTLFQSTASGIISLIEDRENDFSQEMFVAPVSRFSIIIGKIFGESAVAFTQAVAIIVFGLIIGVPLSLGQILTLAPVGLVVCFLGGAFGLLVLANLSSQRSANQIFPFIMFPQFFLAGVFNPIVNLPPFLLILSRIAPMTYPVDLVRGVYYMGQQEYAKTVLYHPAVDLLIIAAMFLVFMTVGTFLFVRNERNR